MDKKKALEKLLLNELKSPDHVRGFVKEWRALGIDVGNINVIDKLVERNDVLLTMLSYYNFGVTSKMIEINEIIKG